MSIRKPSHAGTFYPSKVSDLKRELQKYMPSFLSTKKENVLGIISPHAGYMYSGKVAGAVYSQIKSQPNFIIIGPNHTGIGEDYAIQTEGEWLMPGSSVKINSSIANKILSLSNFLKIDEEAHLHEHSLEVQIPFIEYLNPTAQIIPICIKNYQKNACLDIAKSISDVVINEKAIIVASSDMTHYEPQKNAEKNDKAAIDKILHLDPEGLFNIVTEKNISMCGLVPILIMLYACKNLGAKKCNLISYQTSGDVSGDYNSVVGYAGLSII